MTPTVSPAPRLLIMLVAAIVLVGVPVAAVGGIGLIVYPPYAGAGALLAIRRPRNPIGWLLIGLSWASLLPFVPVPATPAAFQAGTASSFAMLIAWSSAWVPTSGFVGLIIVMIIFRLAICLAADGVAPPSSRSRQLPLPSSWPPWCRR